jgi:hypothetical protein
MKAAAVAAGLSPGTLFSYLGRSRNGDPELRIRWMGAERMFHEHADTARKLSIVALDHSARDQAINGWAEPRFANGMPVYKRDPKLEADALDPETWEMLHGKRDRTDTFLRDASGALVQEEIIHPPNPALLVKLLASLMPGVYGERAEITHTHVGHVWVEGQSREMKQVGNSAAGAGDLQDEMGLIEKRDTAKRPINVLAIPTPCKTSEEFDKKFLKKLVREVVLFRDVDGRLELPLHDDVIVAGSTQDAAFIEAGIEHKTVTAAALIAEGYQNEFLHDLAPDAVPTPSTPPSAPSEKPLTPMRKDLEERAAKLAERPAGVYVPHTEEIMRKRGPSRPEDEGIGVGVVKPGGEVVIRDVHPRVRRPV